MEVIKILIKKELNSEEGLGGCGQVWHYTPGVKFAREGGDLGGCPTTFQHASSLSRRKVGGYIYIYKILAARYASPQNLDPNSNGSYQ